MPSRWTFEIEPIDEFTADVDNVANDMHEENVDAVATDFDALWMKANEGSGS
jgi:hypothetical protein